MQSEAVFGSISTRKGRKTVALASCSGFGGREGQQEVKAEAGQYKCQTMPL